MGKMEFRGRRRLFEESRVLDWCEINGCAFDSVCRDAEP